MKRAARARLGFPPFQEYNSHPGKALIQTVRSVGKKYFQYMGSMA